MDDLAAYDRAIASGRLRTRVRGYMWDELMAELTDGVPQPADMHVNADPDRLVIAGDSQP